MSSENTTPVGGRSTTGLFRPISVDRVSQVIVDQVKALIRDGKLTPGDRLPSERDLCTQFGVSRVTVREALRVLEASGLIEIRVGARGGAFVTRPTAQRVGEGLADLLTLSPLTGSAVTEARLIFELGIMPLVVERATDADVDDLLAMVDTAQQALADDSYDMDMSAQFHIRVATCTHNPAIEMLVRSFHGPLLMSLEVAHVAAPQMGHRGNDEHRELALAIKGRDLESATEIMRTHLQRTASRVKTAEAHDPADTPAG